MATTHGSFFVDVLLDNPNVVGRSSSSLLKLISIIIEESSENKEKIIKHLSGKDVMYPLVSFIIWDIFFTLPYDESTFEAISKRYYSEKWRDLWWYERCIFINYLIEKKVYEINPEAITKITQHIQNIAETISDYERRYVIRLLMKLPDQKGLQLLNEKFSDTNDKSLIEFLRK